MTRRTFAFAMIGMLLFTMVWPTGLIVLYCNGRASGNEVRKEVIALADKSLVPALKAAEKAGDTKRAREIQGFEDDLHHNLRNRGCF